MSSIVRESRRSRRAVVLALAGALVLTACGGGGDAAPAPAPSAPAPQAPAETEPEDDGDWQSGAPAEWETILEAGRREGKVVVGGFPFLADPMAAAFEADTGIKLEWLGASGAEISARVAQEAEAKNVTIDLHLGLGSDPWTLYPQGFLQDLRDKLILPKVKNGENWRGGSLRWIDPEQGFFIQGSEYVHGWAIVNTDLIDPSELKEWSDLLDPKYKGKIAAQDPTVPGPGQGAANFLQVMFGMDFVLDLFLEQEIEYTRDPGQLVEWAARGEYPIVLGTIQSNVERFRAQGFKLEAALPGYLTGGFSPVKMAVGGPHPNAATVFLNWYLSEPGQRVYSEVLLEQTLRADTEFDFLPAYVDPDQYPYLDFNGYEWDYYVNQRSGLLKILVEALQGSR